MADNNLFDSTPDFADGWYISRNGREHSSSSHHSVYTSSYSNSIPNRKTNAKRVELGLIFKLLTLVGFGSYFTAIYLNWGSWKANLLIIIMAAGGIVKVYRMYHKARNDNKRERLEIKILEKESNRE